MNDFTKEELGLIYKSCATEALNGWSNYSVDFLNKIKSMIDNYCEHSWAFHFSANGSRVACMKCSKELK